MLEAFRKDIISALDVRGGFPAAYEFSDQYSKIRRLLKRNLNSEQMKFIPTVYGLYGESSIQSRGAKLQELASAANMAIAYLQSLDRDLQKEIDEKEQEIKRKEKEIESIKKIYTEALEAIGQLPEVQRSKAVAEWKKHHREIEENSRKKYPPVIFTTTKKKE